MKKVKSKHMLIHVRLRNNFLRMADTMPPGRQKPAKDADAEPTVGTNNRLGQGKATSENVFRMHEKPVIRKDTQGTPVGQKQMTVTRRTELLLTETHCRNGINRL